MFSAYVLFIVLIVYKTHSLTSEETNSLCYLIGNLTGLSNNGWDCTKSTCVGKGLKCVNNAVTEIDLYVVSSGTFPKGLKFPSLKIFRIREGAKYTGEFPTFWYNCLNIEFVEISGFTYSSGGMPPFTQILENLLELEIYEPDGGDITLPYNLHIKLPNLLELHLEEAGFYGAFPQLPTSIQVIHFYGNKFSNFPDFTLFPNLIEFQFSENPVSDTTFPISMNNHQKLKYVYLWGIKFSSVPYLTLPSLLELEISIKDMSAFPSLSGLPKLEALGINGDEEQSVTLPDFKVLKNTLKFLYLVEMDLQGLYCDNLTNGLTKLELLHLDDLNCIPPPDYIGTLIAQAPNLIDLDLENMEISTPIPSSVAVSKLKYLSLEECRMKGTISNDLFPPTLLELELDENNITGTLPDFAPFKDTMTLLNLRFNEFSGTIPALLGEFKVLNHLELDHNKLFGTIPSTFRDLQLEYLELTGNPGLVNCITPIHAIECVIDAVHTPCTLCKNSSVHFLSDGSYTPSLFNSDYTVNYYCTCDKMCGSPVCYKSTMCVSAKTKEDLTCIDGRWVGDFNITEDFHTTIGEYLFQNSIEVLNESTFFISENSKVIINGSINIAVGSVISVDEQSLLFIKGSATLPSFMTLNISPEKNPRGTPIINVSGCVNLGGNLSVKLSDQLNVSGVNRDIDLVLASCYSGSFSSITTDIPCTTSTISKTSAGGLSLLLRPLSSAACYGNPAPPNNENNNNNTNSSIDPYSEPDSPDIFSDFFLSDNLYYMIGGAVALITVIAVIVVIAIIKCRHHRVNNELRGSKRAVY